MHNFWSLNKLAFRDWKAYWLPVRKKETILARLTEHLPVANEVVQRLIWIRWMTTIALGSLFPIAFWLVLQPKSQWGNLTGDTLLILIAIGGMGILLGMLAARKKGHFSQWSYAKLNEEEMEEMIDLAMKFPEIETEINQWFKTWMDLNCSLRGRDLMLLKRMVQAWERHVKPQ